MLKRIFMLAGCAALLMAVGCSKLEEASEKGTKAVDKVIMDPQRKAEDAKDAMNAAIKNMDKSIKRATEDVKDKAEDLSK
ncbi:MAG: hypothetical protein KAR83_04985 [Thermodesulfovibrionales bacterium]|nr:hypothetical protein [Thermodesulfovibrionales bacterium]